MSHKNYYFSLSTMKRTEHLSAFLMLAILLFLQQGSKMIQLSEWITFSMTPAGINYLVSNSNDQLCVEGKGKVTSVTYRTCTHLSDDTNHHLYI